MSFVIQAAWVKGIYGISKKTAGERSMNTQNLDRRDPEWVAEIASKRIVYTVPGMEQVEVRRDVVYKSTDEAELKADIYIPADSSDAERRPAIIFIHGGALPPNLRTQPKEWGTFVSFGQLAAAFGFVGITFNHRFYGVDEKTFEQSIGDVTDAIAYVRSYAESLHVDPQRICLWAFSGGGPHLTIALREPLNYVRCLIAYYTILDLVQLPKNADTPGPSTDFLERYSAVQYINDSNNHIPPLFVARAGQDVPFLNASIDKFVERAFAHGVDIDVCNHATGRHGFDILDDNQRSREIISRTMHFAKANLVERSNGL
jgi:acetyl esterase/lipase